MSSVTTETTQQAAQPPAQVTFLDRAKRMVNLGVPVIRLRPRSKKPLDDEWQNLATTDLDQIHKWNDETPDANCGSVAKSDGVLFFESDEPGVIKKFQEETGESFKTFTAQSRPGRFHFYFHSTDLTRKVGSITQKELRFGSLRQHNAFCVSPNSIHPDTGLPYTIVRDVPIIPAPDALINWLVSKKNETQPIQLAVPQPGQIITLGGRNTALTSQAGKLRRDGLEQSEIETVLLRFNAENCKPPLPEHEVRTIAWSIGKKPAGPVGPTVLIGGVEAGVPAPPVAPSAGDIELQQIADSTPQSAEEDAGTIVDSEYPYWAWIGTPYWDFATFCGKNNLIPKEIFIEAIKTFIGGICGHRFSPQEGRFYTFILTKVGGIGKGTAFGALRNLFAGTGLFYASTQDGSGPFMNLGCAEGNFGSSGGMLNGGFALHNRILQVYDELTKLLEKFSIPGSGDGFLDDLNTLFEADGYTPSVTKNSKVGGGVSGAVHNSILGGTTVDKWVSAFSKTTAEGSGFFQRLNLISSDETQTVAEVDKFEFNEGTPGHPIRQQILAKIAPLEFQTVVFEKTPDAAKEFKEWHERFKKEHADDPSDVTGRLNVLVSRNYEHIAYMLAPEIKPNPGAAEPIKITCDLLTMQKAIALSEYQYKIRMKHRPASGANESAIIEDSIRLTLLATGKSMSRSDLYKKSGSKKYGLLAFNRTLDAMHTEGVLTIATKSNSTVRGRKGQVVIWSGDK